MPSSNIFYFCGNLPLTIEGVLSEWRNSFVSRFGSHTLSRIGLHDLNPEALFGELTTPPFLAEKRLVIVDAGKAESGKPNAKYQDGEFWKSLFGSIPQSNIVAWKGVDSEELSELHAILSETATIKEYRISTPAESLSYIRRALPNVSLAQAQEILDRIGENSLLLENEIQKLGLLENVSSSDIRENLTQTTDIKVFAILDAVIAGQSSRSVELFRKSLISTDVTEFFRGYVGALRKPGLYAAMLLSGVRSSDAENALELKDFVAKKYRSLSRSGLVAMVEHYREISRIDLGLKTGKLVGEGEPLEHAIETALLRQHFILQAG